MSHTSTINNIATLFNSSWNKVVTPIEWPNVPKKHDVVPYVRFSVSFFTTRNATVGTLPKKNYSGLIVIGIFVPVNKGYGTALLLADDVFTIFQNTQFNSIFTYAGSVVDVGKDPLDSNLYQINAQVPFESIVS